MSTLNKGRKLEICTPSLQDTLFWGDVYPSLYTRAIRKATSASECFSQTSVHSDVRPALGPVGRDLPALFFGFNSRCSTIPETGAINFDRSSLLNVITHWSVQSPWERNPFVKQSNSSAMLLILRLLLLMTSSCTPLAVAELL